MRKKGLAFGMAMLVMVLAVPAIPTTAASVDRAYAQTVITTTGIMNTDDGAGVSTGTLVTRAQYAQMLGNISAYRDMATGTSRTSVYKDVKRTNWASGYIRTAVQSGWMNGYVDGRFKPEQAVTLQEAVNGIVRLLGYTNSDFQGNKNSSKMALYRSLHLDENIALFANDPLTRSDAVNLFYNTLVAKAKDGRIYGTTIGYTVSAEGELEYAGLVNKNMTGPVIADGNWAGAVPFSLSEAVVYRNGYAGSIASIQPFDVLYYSKSAKTIWAYSEKISGTIKSVAPNRIAPTSVTMAGHTYTLGSQSAAYDVSTSGRFQVGDTATLLLGKDGTVVKVLSQSERAATVTGVVLRTGETLVTNAAGQIAMTPYVVLVDAYGREIQSEYAGKASDYTLGQVVTLTYNAGTAQIALNNQRFTAPLTGKVNSTATAIGSRALANDVRILDIKNTSYVQINRTRLADFQLNSGDVLYYGLNTAGEVTELILNNVTGDSYRYGILLEDNLMNSMPGSISATYHYLIAGEESTYTTATPIGGVQKGVVRFGLNGAALVSMANLASVTVTSIAGDRILSNGQTYILADEVDVYYQKNDTYLKTTLASVSDLNRYSLSAYYDFAASSGGRIRIVIAQSK